MTTALVPVTRPHDITWAPGQTAWFEYHCWESVQSADADLWMRSHQRVTVTGWGESDGWELASPDERIEAGMPRVYGVRFEDGHEGTVFEDELAPHTGWWFCRHPPGWVDVSDLNGRLDTITK